MKRCRKSFHDLGYRFAGPESGVDATLIAVGQSSGDDPFTGLLSR